MVQLLGLKYVKLVKKSGWKVLWSRVTDLYIHYTWSCERGFHVTRGRVPEFKIVLSFCLFGHIFVLTWTFVRQKLLNAQQWLHQIFNKDNFIVVLEYIYT